ncbi:MAG: hypothetical protein ACKO9B_02840, partial [Planctomycetota bacterium]
MNVAESVSAARGMMKMGRVMRVAPGMRVVAVFLVLSLGRIFAAGWEDGVALDDSGAPLDAHVSSPANPAAETPELIPDQPLPSDAHPWHPPQAHNGDPALPHCEQNHFSECTTTCRDAKWTFRADALLLWRNAPPQRAIFSTIDPVAGGLGPTALDA